MKKLFLVVGVLAVIALVVAPASADRWAGYEVEITPGPDGMVSGTFTISGEGEYGLIDLAGSWSADLASRPPIVHIVVAGVVIRADGEVVEIDHEFMLNGNGNNVGVGIRQIIEWAQSILEG